MSRGAGIKIKDAELLPPLEIRWPSVAEAEAALAAHLAKCPGEYLECFGNPELEKARRAWIERKSLLKSELDAARNMARQKWREVTPSAPKPISEPITLPEPETPEIPMPKKKTPEEKLVTMLARLERLVAEDERRQASNLRCQIRAHCEENGLETPALPLSQDKRPKPMVMHRMAEAPAQVPEVAHPAPSCPLDAVTILQTAIMTAGELRRNVWRLLERVDELTPEERRAPELLAALGNLDAAAHLVATLAATGRIEVGA